MPRPQPYPALTRPLPPRHRLVHQLTPELERLGEIRRRRHLKRNRIYKRIAPEIDRVLEGFEWDLSIAPPPMRPKLADDRVRAVAWNVERGKRFDGVRALLRQHEVLGQADLIYLNLPKVHRYIRESQIVRAVLQTNSEAASFVHPR